MTDHDIAAIDLRRQRLHERLELDSDYLALEVDGRLKEIVDDCLNLMRAEQDPVRLYALKERWLLAEENYHHHRRTVESYKARSRSLADAAAREARGLPPADPHE